MNALPHGVPVYDSGAFRLPLVAEARELFRYRFLVWNLIARDLKVRYKRSILGFVWVMLNPLLTMAVLTVVFSQVFRFNVAHYAVYVLAGTLLWSLFAQGSVAAMSGLQGSGGIIRKLYVPPSVFVASAVGSAVVNLLFALVPFVALALVEGLTISPTWLFIIYPAILVTLFTMGVGLIVGSLIVFFNDTFEIYQVVLQAYYFFTPVFYPVKQLPEPLKTIESFNPMFLFLESFRNAIMLNQLPGEHMVRATLIAVATLLVGWIFFTRVEGKFVYQF